MRVILIVLDSFGVGELPDASEYGDQGSNTLMNIIKKSPSLDLKNMLSLGLGHIDGLGALRDNNVVPAGAFGKLGEASKGKDTTMGHWEISGVITSIPFPTYPKGFPEDVLEEFSQKTNRKVIGNCAFSGTEVLARFGDEHMTTGALIVYTSADSVFQIAAHEDVVPIDELYDICQKARAMLIGAHNVSRVIARPFIGGNGNYTRTKNRKDFSLDPTGTTMLDHIKNASLQVAAVGKIEDIFAGKGITSSVHTENNMEGIIKTIECMDSCGDGLIFTNLVDFDMVFGHRNDYIGYGKALEEFDRMLPKIMTKLHKNDVLMITADHGCDPTTSGTDHSREYIPLLIYGDNITDNINLKTRGSFADIGATILDYLGVKAAVRGKSFLSEILINNN